MTHNKDFSLNHFVLIIYHYPTTNLKGKSTKITIASGPVIINKENKFLLHKAQSTGKFQFTGGRITSNKSLHSIAKLIPFEDLGINVKILTQIEPFIVVDNIKRDKEKETLVLIHYLAKLNAKEKIKGKQGKDWDWFSLDEIKKMEKEDKVSTANIRLACQHFLS